MRYLTYFGRAFVAVYWVGFAGMFSFVMYANWPPPLLSDPVSCLYILGMATFLAMFWPVALYFGYMLTHHH